ncbi:MAG TPA: sugar phosphate nucleotidyltransferase, partial [Dissulfurispiraceae bacterium]|nr:sugar phosphate nucleotidyltransferase [Dissulfurispiraceae bacterium]
MPDRIRAFILAAGLGERLRPLTNHIPKPLLPILGTPILELILDRVFSIPVEMMGVNLYHKGDLIRRWIERSGFAGKIAIFPEDPILSTGGALKNAEKFLDGGPFVVHNGDILSDIDIGQLLSRHLSLHNLATLAVHHHPEFENLSVSADGLLMRARSDAALPGEAGRFAFTGIAAYDPAFLSLLPAGRSDVVDAWNHAVSQGFTIGTVDVTGCRWSDIGTPVSYAQTLRDVLRADGERLYIGRNVKGCGRSNLHGWAVIEEGASLGDGSSLKDCVVLPGAVVRAGARLADCIIGPDFEIPLNRASAPDRSTDEPELIGTGGSDRTYYRVTRKDTTAVLMKCRESDPDFHRHVELTRFFGDCRVPVPELFEHDEHAMTAVFEDLGDTSLYDWLKCPRGSCEIREMYGKALDGLILLHSAASARMNECPPALARRFDYD